MTTSDAMPTSLVLVGAGKMGGAMLEGWLRRGLRPQAVTAVEPRPSSELARAAGERGFRLVSDAEGVARPEILVLAVKPQALEEVAPDIAPLVGPDTLVLSILAGTTVAGLVRALPGVRAIVRAMPNLPASIGRGATGAFASSDVSTEQRRMADALLSGNGMVEWVGDENLIDAVTAVSGSGPAYVFHLVECLAEAGVAAGLAEDVARRLALATVVGAGELLDRSGLEPGQLRQNVTSPGGTTAAALSVLMGPAGLAPLLREAVAAAKNRARELAG